MTFQDPIQIQKAEVIISDYFKLYNFLKKYMIFALGISLGVILFAYFLLRPNNNTVDSAQLKDGIWYEKIDEGVKARSIYVSDGPTLMWDFSGKVIWDYFLYRDGQFYSKNNFLTYQDIPLPQDFIAEKSNNYLWSTPNEKVTNYIKYFINLDNKLFDDLRISWSAVTLPKVNYKKHFKLSCLDSRFKFINAFCDYNLEYFASNLYKYDVSYDFDTVLGIFNKTDKEYIRNYICTSVSNYEMLTRNIDKRFNQIFDMCDAKFKTTHIMLTKFNDLDKQIGTQLDPMIDQDRIRDIYKLVSIMWKLQQQISYDNVELWLLNSYNEFVTNILTSSLPLDQFYIDLIYRYHNQRLLPWLEKIQTKVNLTTVQDIKNASAKIDALNYSNGVWFAWLYNMVTREVVMDNDYAVQNGWLVQVPTTNLTWSNSWQVAQDILNAVTNIIDDSINRPNIALVPISEPTQSTPNDDNNDLNTYNPSKLNNTYVPSSSVNSMLWAIQNRFVNYMGIAPTSATSRGDKYYVVFDYQDFNFGTLLDINDDWKLSPIYVKIDWSMTLIPELEIFLMDYDRYTQIKFLKNTAEYVRSANQNQ